MRAVGVIAEYDPFHLGHAYHLAQAREITGADWVVVVLSGCFTQRGQAATVLPSVRAEMALSCGADAVIELPCLWAVREAEHFALGGVSMLHRLGCITHLAFGAENDDLPVLQRCAEMLEAPDAAFQQLVRSGLEQGLSHPAALGKAVERRFPEAEISKPNNVLALCYLRALLRLHSPIEPVLIRRCGDYHATGFQAEALPSATAVRGALHRGCWTQVQASMPAPAYALLRRAAASGEVFHPGALDTVLLHLLRTAPLSALRALPGCGEGLENRLRDAAFAAHDREQLLQLMKTRRYPYARLSRLCAHLLLGLEEQTVRPGVLPAYGRLLGFRREAAPLLRAMKKGGLPLIEKAAHGPRNDAAFQADARAYDLWCLGAGMTPERWWRQSPVVAG